MLRHVPELSSWEKLAVSDISEATLRRSIEKVLIPLLQHTAINAIVSCTL